MPGPNWVQATDDGKRDSGNGYRWGDCRSLSECSIDERHFVENHDRAETLAESSDPDASYDYDDYALALLDGRYYVFNTSGCSCPSPEETWGLCFVGDLPALLDYLDPPEQGCQESFAEFLRQVEKVLTLKNPAPAPKADRRW